VATCTPPIVRAAGEGEGEGEGDGDAGSGDPAIVITAAANKAGIIFPSFPQEREKILFPGV
jgi:hypothetical protein